MSAAGTCTTVSAGSYPTESFTYSSSGSPFSTVTRWEGVAASADFNTIIATDSSTNKVYKSTDSGQSWVRTISTFILRGQYLYFSFSLYLYFSYSYLSTSVLSGALESQSLSSSITSYNDMHILT